MCERSIAMQNNQLSNHLLRLLPAIDQRRLISVAETVALVPGEIILDRSKMRHVYFPCSGMITKAVRMGSGDQIEAGMIGNEGMIPLCLFLGIDVTPFVAEVQIPGQALRLSAKEFKLQVRRSPMLHSVLLRFAAAFMSQVSLSAACKTLHPLRAQLARWLLMIHDRIGSTQFTMTQETIANMLGVRRVSITSVAREFQQAGLIAYRRGKIQIIDLPRLKKEACECYGRINEVYDALRVAPDTKATKKNK